MFDKSITFRARSHPDTQAFVSLDGTASYAAFDGDIDRVAGALADHAGVRPGALAAVRAANPYLHWLVLLALARLGVASGPPVPEMSATLHLTDQPGDAGDVLLSVDWVRAVLTAPRPTIPILTLDPAALARVMPSSGTTGSRKLVGYSWSWIDTAAKDGLVACANIALRMMVLTGTDTLMGFVNLISAWYGGGTVLAAPMLPALPEVLPRLKPTILVMATGQLAWLIENLPSDYVAPPGMRVGVAGSMLHPALARRAIEVLRCELTTSYGATEAGLVAVMQGGSAQHTPDAVGYVVPRKVVEVVDPDGRPVPPGEEGEVRVRGELVLGSYLGDPDATAQVFRDGWFYPGDIGRLEADQMLRISGRVDDVINIGGVKFLPSALELPAGACPGVVDAVCFLVGGGTDKATVNLAVVRGPGFEEDLLVDVFRSGALMVVPRLVWVDTIPRNAMGKPDRARLAAAVAAYTSAAVDVPLSGQV